jgi:hypothetical protein
LKEKIIKSAEQKVGEKMVIAALLDAQPSDMLHDPVFQKMEGVLWQSNKRD